MHEAEDAPDVDSGHSSSDVEASNDDFAYVLSAKISDGTCPHPSADVVHQLWHIFIENVNPLSKLVHVPSLQLAIEKALLNPTRIPRGFEALMFAVYSMAVLSLSDKECRELLGETRAMLLPRYVAATKIALARAKFMSSTSVVVLQALVLHILCIRDDHHPRAVWSLTGTAIRIAEGMGMRLDGTLLGLSPFETKIHRRIWWQLKMHDFRAAELCGQAKFRDFNIDETTPKKPANVNDSELYPSMTQAPTESTKPTEMIWIMFRSDLASFAASQKVKMEKSGKTTLSSEEYSAMDDLKMKDGFIKTMEDMLETKYLRFCDPSRPIQFLTLLAGRASTNLIRFIAHHPRRWANMDKVPATEQQLVWGIVIQLLEQYNMLQSSPQLRQFAWNTPYFIQWHAVIHVLDTLRAMPLHSDSTKAWRLIDALYKNNLDMLLSTKRPISVAVGNLCLKAFTARTIALEKAGRSPPGPPDYIAKLREQRQAAKARREVAIARIKGREAVNHQLVATTTGVGDIGLGVKPQPSQAPTNTQFQPTQESNHEGTWARDDAFWLNDALNPDFFAGGSNDMMNIDADAILAQDSWLDTPNGEAVDWAQWETLLIQG